MRLFRRFLRLIAALLFVSLAGFVILLIAARMHDGPLGMIAGGALKSGELAIGAEPDWRFAHDLPTVELQLLEPARSRTTWILEVDGRIYIVSGYMNSMLGKLWKQWPPEAERDGATAPFQRATNMADGEKNPGSGLGLAIVKAAAVSLHGQLTLGKSRWGGLLARLSLPTAEMN